MAGGALFEVVVAVAVAVAAVAAVLEAPGLLGGLVSMRVLLVNLLPESHKYGIM